MDEEDGRPGHRARKSELVDVLSDASTWSLCCSRPILKQKRQPRHISRLVIIGLFRANHPQITVGSGAFFHGPDLQKTSASLQVEEKHYEDLPGK
jgi:hypothetical protein